MPAVRSFSFADVFSLFIIAGGAFHVSDLSGPVLLAEGRAGRKRINGCALGMALGWELGTIDDCDVAHDIKMINVEIPEPLFYKQFRDYNKQQYEDSLLSSGGCEIDDLVLIVL